MINKSQYAKYEGGFGMSFDYHGFDVSTDFVFKQGNYIYNLRKRDLLSKTETSVLTRPNVTLHTATEESRI